MAARVLWVIKGLGPGGAERLLCAAARTHDASRFHIECAFVLPYKDHLADELERAGVSTRCLSRRRTDIRWPVRLTELIRNGGFDIVHVHSPLPGAVARLAVRTLPRRGRPKLVSTEHNAWATHRTLTRWLNALTSRFDDVGFAVTDEVRNSMSGPVTTRVETLQHGIDVAATAEAVAHRQAIREEFGIGPAEIVVGTVANFRPQKDYPNLLNAARLLADRAVPVRFIAVGQGPREAETRRLHHDLGLDHMVILTGFRDDAVRVMAACDIFSLASRWEGLPVALMEALALGLPIVATDVGGIGEALVDDASALLVPPRDAGALADAIERVVTDHDLRARLGRAAATMAHDFDVRRAVDRIEAAYTELAPDAATQPAVAAPPKQRRPLPHGLRIREATPADRPAILELCRASLGWGDDPRFEQLFAWKHDQNVFGPSYMWVATDGTKVVGLRAFMRWEFVRGREVLRAVRAVDTATHPDHQGKGLFTAMTMHGLDVVADDGIDFVFNTPNDKSRPGYLKLGWQDVGRLPVAIKLAGPKAALTVARSRTAASLWPIEFGIGEPIAEVLGRIDVVPVCADDPRSLVTNRSDDFVRWRYGLTSLGYRAVAVGEGVLIVRSRRRGDSRELDVLDILDRAGDRTAQCDRVVSSILASVGATHAVRLGGPDLRAGFVAFPGGGPRLTFRSVVEQACPPLTQWRLGLGDVELF